MARLLKDHGEIRLLVNGNSSTPEYFQSKSRPTVSFPWETLSLEIETVRKIIEEGNVGEYGFLCLASLSFGREAQEARKRYLRGDSS